jgi:crotonobetainyl-CoA:carnitine CoA-transferase CaiB-like acyl-CoA transferase
MLSPYRVLDLTDERGLLCGQVLGDLGADAIAVEPPGGSPARRIGPFHEDEPGPERSLYWWAFARNKRGVTLDVTRDEGRALLLRLVEGADVLIESAAPGAMAALGLGYDALAATNPALIYVSISPFGQDGPKANHAASDLTVWAAAGPLALTGDHDRPPVRLSVPQTFLHAGAEAATGALVALLERHRSERGQHVDVSAQQAVNQATFASSLQTPLGFKDSGRVAGGVRYGPLKMRWVYPAKDGYVAVSLLFGSAAGPMTRRLMEYIFEEGGCDEATRDKDWIAYTELVFSGQEPQEEYERVKQVVSDFTATKTKAELLAAALERGLLIAPVTTLGEVTESEQLAARGYWRDIEHPDGGATVRGPGPFAQFSATPLTYRRRAPSVGEHNREVYVDELGLSAGELADLEAKGIV